MSSQNAKVLVGRTNGVLPVPVSRTIETPKGSNESTKKASRGRSNNEKQTGSTKPARTKPVDEGEKLVVRLLPPGMTELEFSSTLGPDWGKGKGKVDWFSFMPGKLSNDPSKPSRPGRAHFHVVKKEYTIPLSETVRAATWEDAKMSFTSSCLISSPYVEFAIYKKTPGARKRQDTRQGTIDQDPEFMAFLEELASPALPREANAHADDGEEAVRTDNKITTTPLVEYLKEKSASKAKESSGNKTSRHIRVDSPASKGKIVKDEEAGRKRGKPEKIDKPEKPHKEAIKILMKKDVPEPVGETSKPTPEVPGTAESPKGRRAGIAAAARLLQRDLGLSPGSAHRKARQDAAKTGTDSGKESTINPTRATGLVERCSSPIRSTVDPLPKPTKASPEPTTVIQKGHSLAKKTRGARNADKVKGSEDVSVAANAMPTKPTIIHRKASADEPSHRSIEASRPSPATASKGNSVPTTSVAKTVTTKILPSQKKPATASTESTRGFVKHANSSQGITEPLLKQAMEACGPVTFIEVDRRKGFAYVDFADHGSLLKAIKASPITVAQGTVQVLERKDKKPTAIPVANTNVPTGGHLEKATSSTRGRRGRGNATGKAGSSAASTTAAG